MIKITTALKMIKKLRKRKRIVQGGQGASKTFSIMMLLVDYAIKRPNTTITVFQHELSKMRRTVILDFINIMKSLDYFRDSEWLGGTVYKYPNGSFIEFVGLDKEDIGKGFRRDIGYFNEANRGISFNTFQQIESRCKIVYIDFNPDREFWVHKEVMTGNDFDFLIVDHTHNEHLNHIERNNILEYKRKGFLNPDIASYDQKDNIKSEYWANKWRVYGCGQVGVLEGQIYNWNVIDTVPDDAELISYGLDFGFNDPTVLVELYKYNLGYIVNQRLWRTQMDASEYPKVFESLNLNKKITIRADGARPELIATIKKLGLSIEGVDKAQKNDRILLLSSETISVTRQSKELIHEQQNYVWKKTNDGSNKDVPIETDDHGMDATLYSADKVVIRLKRKSSGLKVIDYD